MNHAKGIKILLICSENTVYDVLLFFKNYNPIFQIVGISIPLYDNLNIEESIPPQIPIIDNYVDFIKSNNIDIIIDTTESASIISQIEANKSTKTSLLHKNILSAIKDINIYYKSLHDEIIELKDFLKRNYSILNSTSEAIQVSDNDGEILFVNKAYTEVTGIKYEDRIGKNIYDIDPNGALVETLTTKAPVLNKILITNTGVEVICNSSPIIIDELMVGAVVVFRDISDIIKMNKKLQEYRNDIESLKREFNDITSASAKYNFSSIIGNSPEMYKCNELAKLVSQNNTTTLITGESGTGKELYASAIHNYGKRANKPFIAINCTAIPNKLLESELFGYEKGAFTGAVSQKLGKFELAHHGTLFLDEIGDMSMELQGKLLRVLQEKEIERLGGNKTIKIDVQIIAATNADLLKKIYDGQFRSDLYYRLNVIPIHIPPLRERKGDIELLVHHFIDKKNKKFNKNCTIEKCALIKLEKYFWPGNVRELENVLERAVLMCNNGIIDHNLILLYPVKEEISSFENINLEDNEKELIKKALSKYEDSVKGKKLAANDLNISLSSLYNKIKLYDL
ncbi:MAG: sigma 54-interacting transcriptional regulator [Tissierellia bacterium]|nr:sigma 54-interacting transcriptional regulator [Tissierellia bacterium]